MVLNSWHKSADTLVLRDKSHSGLAVVNQLTGLKRSLDSRQTAAWAAWEGAPDSFTDRDIENLSTEGFILAPESHGATYNSLNIDSLVPQVSDKYIKWYAESPDLHILFNTQQTPFNNPLLALAPYGSLCWRGLVAGWSIGQIRREALRVFGRDEVAPFLKRLMMLGFIKEIDGLDGHLPPAELLKKEFSAPEVQFQLSQSVIPWYCLWELNTACDLRCEICYLPHFKDKGPDKADALSLMRQLVETGIFYVGMLGGEPLLRDDLEELVGSLRDEGVFVKTITNGQRLTPGRARALADAGLNQIEVSFDGLFQDSHERSRGVGTYLRASQAIRHAQQAGIKRTGMVWTIHSGNIAELDYLPEFMLRLGINECYISLFKKTGLNGARAQFGVVGPEAVRLIKQRIDNWKNSIPGLTIVLLPGCSCGRTSVVVGHNGDIRLCSFSYESVGNVYQSGFKDIWRSLETRLPEAGPLGYCTTLKESQMRLSALYKLESR